MTTKVAQPVPRRSRLAVGLLAGALLLGGSAARAEATSARPTRLAGIVTGRITDARTTLPLAGTTIQVVGTGLEATSDNEGRYRIAGVPAGAQVLLARRIGYAGVRRPITVRDDQPVSADFALEPSAFSLEDIVVTGTAGGEQRRSLGNSVAVIDASTALERSAAPTLTSLLNARAPGAIITPGSGRAWPRRRPPTRRR